MHFIDLVTNAREGDEQAYAELIRRFQGVACMSSWKRVQPSGPRDSAQNLPQRSTHACGTATHSMP
jgi:hypothetical protein